MTAPAQGASSAPEILLAGVVDYAGLFPPASFDMAAAVSEYARARASGDAAALGRFVVAAHDLEEFARETVASGALGWRLSVLLPDPIDISLAQLVRFNTSQRTTGHHIGDAVEFRAATPEEINTKLGSIPLDLRAFIEIPLIEDITPLIEAIRAGGASAKARLGGVTSAAFPKTANVVRFLRICADHAVAFKATAGLHHALRGDYPLTYAPDSPRATMFGWVSLMIAAALVRQGASDAQLAKLLEEHDPKAFTLSPTGIAWRGFFVDTTILADTRHRFAVGFGSCSFREPVDELHALVAQ